MKALLHILHWCPRIICILAILFVSLFALDAFASHLSLGQQISDFLVHMIPSLLLIGLLIVAWRWEFIGGVLFALIGLVFSPFIFVLNYNRNHSVGQSLETVLFITFPFIVVGLLFILDHYKRKNLNKE